MPLFILASSYSYARMSPDEIDVTGGRYYVDAAFDSKNYKEQDITNIKNSHIIQTDVTYRFCSQLYEWVRHHGYDFNNGGNDADRLNDGYDIDGGPRPFFLCGGSYLSPVANLGGCDVHTTGFFISDIGITLVRSDYEA